MIHGGDKLPSYLWYIACLVSNNIIVCPEKCQSLQQKHCVNSKANSLKTTVYFEFFISLLFFQKKKRNAFKVISAQFS